MPSQSAPIEHADVLQSVSRSPVPVFRLIAVTLNGAPRAFDAPLSIDVLLGELALAGRRVAVEVNGEIVPKGRHPSTVVADGDRVEIVIAVGGG